MENDYIPEDWVDSQLDVESLDDIEVPTEPDTSVEGVTDGTESTKGIGGIDVVANGEVVATSASDGSFTATVPVGTTKLTIQRKNVTINRTVTLTGTKDISNAEIPVCS
jgi:hypothetical protein